MNRFYNYFFKEKHSLSTHIKWFVTAFTITVIIILSHKAHQVFYQKWQAEGHAYDTFGEDIESRILIIIRYKIYNLDGGNSFLSKMLRSLHKNILKSAYKKIPESDGERVVWRINYNIEKIRQRKSNTNKENLLPEMLIDFNDLTSENIDSLYVREYLRPFYVVEIARFFLQNKENYYLENKHYWENIVVIRMLNLAKEINLNKFIHEKNLSIKFTPLSLVYLSYLQSTEMILNKPNLDCSNIIIENNKFLLRKYTEFFLIYKNLALNKNEKDNLEEIDNQIKKNKSQLEQIHNCYRGKS